MNIGQYSDVVRSRMSEKRYIHSLNVAKQAVRLAKLYGADVQKAEIAGLIHDVTKETPWDVQLQLISDGGIILDNVTENSKKLWHAVSGSAYAMTELKICDEDILNAVRYHTTGRKGMSLLEKIIFVADFTGDERCYNGVEIMREKALRSLEEAMLYGLSFTISDLVSRGMTVHPDALAAYNEIILTKEENE